VNAEVSVARPRISCDPVEVTTLEQQDE